MGMADLMFVHIMLPYEVLVKSLFLGRVFGVLRLQRWVSFFAWTTAWGKIIM